jgi:orotate phosphoribosyltransferase
MPELSRRDIEELLRQRGVLLEGHFLLTSGRHSACYFEKFRILEHPGDADRLCTQMAEHFKSTGIDVVVGPTTGGIILAFAVARHLGVRALYAEKSPEGRGFFRGMALSPGERVLVVDDVLTTGGSVKDTIAAVERGGGKLQGIGVLIDRSEGPLNLRAPVFSLYRQVVESFLPGDCPLCKAGSTPVAPGASQRTG